MPGEKWTVELGAGTKIVLTPKDEAAAQALQNALEPIQQQAQNWEIWGIKEKQLSLMKQLQESLGQLNLPEHSLSIQKITEPDPFFYSSDFLKEMGKPSPSILDKIMGVFEKVGDVAQEPKDLQERSWFRTHGQERLVMYPRKAQEGYQDETIDPGWLSYHNVQDLLARFFLTIHASNGEIRNWRPYCIGITSQIDRGDNPKDEINWHMPMFDYDGKNIRTRVKADVKKLQKAYGLGDATLYTTQNGLHVYFFSDMVPQGEYMSMLEDIKCCKGFKEAAQRKGCAVLRVSAKYTDFDIFPYKTVVSPNRIATRPRKKAALIKALLQLGRNCGTHFASLYPQWAYYEEDPRPWRPETKRRTGKRIRKVSKEDYEVAKAKKEAVLKKAYAKKNPLKDDQYYYKVNWEGTGWSNVSTTTTVTYNNSSTIKGW